MTLARNSRLRATHFAIAAATFGLAIPWFGACGGSSSTGTSGAATGATGAAGAAGATTGAAGTTTGAAGATTGAAGTAGAAGTTAGAAGGSGTASSGATSGATTGTTVGDGGTGGDAGCAPIGAKLQHSNPIISRGVETVANVGTGALVTDGQYHNGGWGAGLPTTSAPSWVAMKLAAGPSRVLVSWDDGGTYNYQDPAGTTVYGFPADYTIQTSANSTVGSDGVWTTQVTVTGNTVRTRAHSIPFAGQTWVKMVITAAPPAISTNGVQIGEIDVHDISATGTCLPQDTWFFMGDSITAFAYDRGALHQPSFAAGVNTASPPFFPAMINGGIGGETSTNGLARLQQALDLNPDYRFFTLSYGTNDAGNGVGTATFQSNMQMMITMLKSAGRTPIIPHIPYAGKAGYSTIPSYNTIIDSLVQTNGLTPGPDLYQLFAPPTTIDYFTCGCSGGRATDMLHPNDVGLEAMNAAWTAAMRPLYP